MTEDELDRALLKAHAQLTEAKRKIERLKAIRRRPCLHCNELFIPFRKDAKFCGIKCRNDHNNVLRVERKKAEMQQFAGNFHGS